MRDDGLKHLSDDALMIQAQGGDTRAFTELVKRHEATVLRYCAYVCRRPERAKELGQDVFMRIWAHRHRYAGQDRFKAYALTIARRLCWRANAKQSLETLWRQEAENVVAADDGERRQLQGLTMRALQALPHKQREALVLRYVEEMPYAEISALLGVNEATIRSRVHTGLRALSLTLPQEVMS